MTNNLKVFTNGNDTFAAESVERAMRLYQLHLGVDGRGDLEDTHTDEWNEESLDGEMALNIPDEKDFNAAVSAGAEIVARYEYGGVAKMTVGKWVFLKGDEGYLYSLDY